MQRHGEEAETPVGLTTSPVATRLKGVAPAERDAVVLDALLSAAADILGYPNASDVDENAAFAEMGFTSLAGLELIERLSLATGMPLSVTLSFDYPTPLALARYLRRVLDGESPGEPAPAQEKPRERQADEAIAIVGMACRLPGGVCNSEQYWQLLETGSDAIQDFVSDRGWDLEALWDPTGERVGSSSTRRGGFIDGASLFDAAFFGISPREALAMDPQQRLLLEVVWEAFEDGGIDPTDWRGSRTGVFAGCATQDYRECLSGHTELEGYVATSTSSSVISGRVSYTFGFEGPALTVDTACSSSLVALHLACRSLRAGECTLAVAAGVTVLATPQVYVEFSRQGGLSPDGRCRAFGAGADGTGFSEGVAVVLLETLSEARRRGHRVLALVRGSAINQDGASNGLTAPSGRSQERLIREALASAGLAAAEVDAVEGHGTGTRLGDPIEAQALLATYGQGRASGDALWLGSVKSNIGHTQAAAGLAGLIKLVLSMQHELLPKTLHADAPSPEVDWSLGNISLLTRPVPWPARDRPRRAAVSAFGMSGTNAHVILEAVPDTGERDEGAGPASSAAWPWVLSGKSPEALRAQASHLREFVLAHPGLALSDIAHSLLATRAHFGVRGAVRGGDREHMLAGLLALATGEHHEGVLAGEAAPRGKVAFLFPGQGSQWIGMGAELLRTSAVFAESVTRCAKALEPYIDWSLEAVLRGDPDAASLDRIDVVQPALFTMMVSLSAVWRTHGVQPDAVMGHSQGEIAAAHVAGALSLEDAAQVVALRSRALVALAGRGAMASIGLPLAAVELRIAPWGDELQVAAVNGPASVIVSGDRNAMDRLLEACNVDRVWARRIPVDYASHCHHVDSLRAEIVDSLSAIQPRRAEVPFISSVTGQQVDSRELDANYWFENLRRTVRMDWAVRSLVTGGSRTFVEVSPHPVLTVGLQGLLESSEAARDASQVVGTIARGAGGLDRFAASLAELHVHGIEVNWSALQIGQRVPLPTYAFRQQPYWATPLLDEATVSAAGIAPSEHPLLGADVSLPDGDGWLLTARLSPRTQPWLLDHALGGVVLISGTTFLDLALYAAARADCGAVEELILEAPLVLSPGGAVDIQVRVAHVDNAGRRAISFHARPVVRSCHDGESLDWKRQATGVLVGRGADDLAIAQRPARSFSDWPPPGARALDIGSLYERLGRLGYAYGVSFQGLKRAWARGEELFAEIGLDDRQRAQAHRYRVHPALLDPTFHMLASRLGADVTEVKVPFAWREVRIGRPGASSLRVRLAPVGPDTLELTAVDDSGLPVVSVSAVTLQTLAPSVDAESKRLQKDLLVLRWEQLELPTRRADPPLALVGDHPRTPALAGVTSDRPSPPWLLRRMTELSPARGAPLEQAHAAVRAALMLLQEFVRNEDLAGQRLVLVTEGACAVFGTEAPDLAGATVWGLVRSAQSEHPGRFVLIDGDGDTTQAHIEGALALEEDQVAIRGGAAYLPRLRQAPLRGESTVAPTFSPNGTVLITGGTGTLGRLLARHLVAVHGVRSLLLVSRSGAQAAGAAALQAELIGLGVDVSIAACDVSDREALRTLLERVPPERPLKAVIHAAGVLEDSLLESLDPERLARVLRPKLDASWHLHELTCDLELTAFILFSSVAGVLGAPGQANYAAGNTFVDALAARRRANGLPAVSQAWGLWADISQMSGHLVDARRHESGIAPMSAADALQLFDASLSLNEPFSVPARFENSRLELLAKGGTLPALLHDLVRHTPLPSDLERQSLLERLSACRPEQRETMLLGVVRAEVAAVLGHASGDAIDAQRTFKDQGMDSLGAVKLRNRLAALTGLRLQTTLVFEQPTPAAVAQLLNARLDLKAPRPPIDEALDELAALVGSLTSSDERRRVVLRLQALLDSTQPEGHADGAEGPLTANASLREIFDYLDTTLAG